MLKFLKQTFYFLFLALLLMLILDIGTTSIIKNRANFKIKSQPKYIIVGHSHPECAYNDTFINNFKNLGSSGESYFYNYFKLKKLFEQNKSIQYLFVEFTNNQIDSINNQWIWDNKHIDKGYPGYAPFMNFEDVYLLIKKNPKGFINSFSYSNNQKIANIIKGNYNYSNKIGSFFYLIRDKTDSLLKHPNKLFYIRNKGANNPDNISEANLMYLDKILKLASEFNVSVILVRSPLHKKYEGYINEKKFQNLLKSRYTKTIFLDFSKLPLLDSDYGDLEHLNYKGAKKFSIWFDQLLKNGLLEKSNRQDFVDVQIKNFN